MNNTKTHLQKALEAAQTEHMTASVVQKLARTAIGEYKKREQALRTIIHHVFHVNIVRNPVVLNTFKSKTLLMVLDKPAEETFLSEVVEAVLVVAVDPAKEQITFDLTKEAVRLGEGGYLNDVISQLRREIGIVLLLADRHDKCTLTIRRG